MSENRAITRLDPVALGPVIGTATHSHSDDVQLQHYWNLLRRGKWVIIGTTLVCVALAVIYAKRATPVYQSSATILVDARANTGMTFLGGASGQDLPTEMMIIHSRRVAEAVVDSLGLRLVVTDPPRLSRNRFFSYVYVPRDAPSGEYHLTRTAGESFELTRKGSRDHLEHVGIDQRVDLGGGAAVVLAPTALRASDIAFKIIPYRAAAEQLMGSISVSQANTDASVIAIQDKGKDPSLVAAIPNLVAQTYITQRRENKKAQATSTVAFLSGQKDTLFRQLNAAEDALGAYRQSAHMLDPIQQGSAEVSQLLSAKADQANYETELSGLQGLLSALRQAPPGSDARISLYRRALTYPGVAGNPVTAEIMGTLSTLSGQRAELLTRRTPADPEVKDLDARIAAQEADLGSIIQTYMTMVKARLAARENEINQASAGIWGTIPKGAIDYERLTRQVQLVTAAYTMITTRLKDAQIERAVDDSSARILDTAQLPTAPISPNKPLILGISVAIGLMLGFLAVMIHAGLDRAVHTRDDLLKYTGVATLGVIPEINVVPTNITAVTATLGTRLRKMIPRAPVTEPIVVSAEVKEPSEGSKLPARLIAGNNPRSPISEAYRTLRTNITFALADTPPKSLVFSSALPGEGKSVTSTNLAITLAQQGMRVLLVDADMRRGTLNALMNVPREPGLSNVLLNMSKIESAVHQIKLDNAISMSLLTTGTVPPNPAELLGSERMRALLAELEASYDIVIFDSPPLNLVTDAAILGSLADGVIVVVRAGETTGDNLTFAVELLRNVHARIIGTVLNAVDFKRDSRYYGAYGGAYGYHYNYEYGPEKG